MVLPTYTIRRPTAARVPVVVEVPHAGVHVDATSLALCTASARSIAQAADLHVDALVEGCEAGGATILSAHVSRYVVDLNRAPTDHDARSFVEGVGTSAPHGIVWHQTIDGQPCLARPLVEREFRRRLDTFYAPYHAALGGLLEETVEDFGCAVLLCAHSMPSEGLTSRGRPVGRADVVPGTLGRTSARGELIDEVDRVAEAMGLSVRHDDPYQGGFSTANYGRPARGVSAIQIEVARRLYMDERTLALDVRGAARLRGFFRALVDALGARALSHPKPLAAPRGDADRVGVGSAPRGGATPSPLTGPRRR